MTAAQPQLSQEGEQVRLLLAELEAQGIHLEVEGENLRPSRKLPPELRRKLVAHKGALLAHLPRSGQTAATPAPAANLQKFDAEACRAFLEQLHEPGAVFEVRILNTRQKTVSGYFNDPALAVQAVERWSGQAPGVYATLNPVNPALLARSANRLTPYAQQTTADTDITCRRWLLVDTDAIRPAGISSTDDEHAAAMVLTRQVREWLTAQGWPEPILANSGNGGHALYRIDLPNDADSLALVEGCLKALAFQFGSEAVKVDTGVGNAARISKLYGTLVCKGDSTADRPHRLARIPETPARCEPVPVKLLRALAAQVPAVPQPARHNGRVQQPGREPDLEQWLAKHGLAVVRSGPWQQGGKRWILDPCPWNPEHVGGCAYIVQLPNGAIGAGCHHNSCQDFDWHALRKLVDPSWAPYEERHAPAVNGKASSLLTGSLRPPTDPQIDLPKGANLPREQLLSPLGGGGQQLKYHRQTAATLRASYTPSEWLVERLLSLPGIMLLAGIPGVGKTWLVLAIALAVAAGRAFLGRFQVRQGPVLLVLEEEDPSAVLERLDLLYAGLSLSQADGDALPIHFLIQQGVSLVTPEGTLDPELLRHIQELKPVLVVLDTFRRVHGLDENDSGQMSGLFNRLRPLTQLNEQPCSFLLVHHLRKRSEHQEDTLDRLRGSSDIAASVDSVLEVGGQFGNLVVKHSKSKRGPALGTFIVHGDIGTQVVSLKFINPDIKAEIDREALRSWLVKALSQGGPQNLSQLSKAGKPLGYGRDRIRRTCEELVKERIINTSTGPRNSTVYAHNELLLTEGAGAPNNNSGHQDVEGEV